MWRKWYNDIYAQSTLAAAMIDYHQVIDEFSRQEAIESGVALEHINMVTKIICSYGISKDS